MGEARFLGVSHLRMVCCVGSLALVWVSNLVLLPPVGLISGIKSPHFLQCCVCCLPLKLPGESHGSSGMAPCLVPS